MGIWVVSTFWLLWLALLWTFTYKHLSAAFNSFGSIPGSAIAVSAYFIVDLPTGLWASRGQGRQMPDPRGWYSECLGSRRDESQASRIDVSLILKHPPICLHHRVVQALCWQLDSFYLINSLLASLWYLLKCPLSCPHPFVIEVAPILFFGTHVQLSFPP